MRQMHKWKDKIEVNLDNRQIFFLFFGLSVVACFVFALGVMIGRRLDGEQRAMANASQESLALLDAAMELELPMQFQAGLQQPATEGLPKTSSMTAKAPETTEAVEAAPQKPKAEAKPKAPAARAAKPEAKATETVLANGDAKAKPASTTPAGKFTLQMKAFSSKDEAEAFASKLREHGHSVRVDTHVDDGRTWHRVRLGAFGSWGEGVAAKEAFEKKESIIAYVVRMD